MKYILSLAGIAIITSSYKVEHTDNFNNDLAGAHLKGKVKSVATTFDQTIPEQNFDYHKVEIYDEHGNKIADSNFNELHIRPVYHKYKYSQQGMVMEKQQYTQGATDTWTTSFSYDSSGRLNETNRYHSSGRLQKKVVYNYNDEGKNTEQISYTGDGRKSSRTVLKYNASGQLTELSEYSDVYGRMALISHYTYYANGNSTSETYGADHKVERSSVIQQIEIDDNGNCIKWREDIKRNGKQFSAIYKREIAYYQ
jgi:YD repeat-containing protein